MSELVNSLDNSEHVAIHSKKDLYQASATGTGEELDDSIKYFKYLKLRAEIESGDGKSIMIEGKDGEKEAVAININ